MTLAHETFHKRGLIRSVRDDISCSLLHKVQHAMHGPCNTEEGRAATVMLQADP